MATTNETEVRPSIHEPQHLFLGGTATPSADGSTFPVVNPMTGAKLYDCAAATLDDCSRAISFATAAFGPWSRSSPSSRRRIFLRAADILERYLHEDAPEILSSEVSATRGWVRVNILGTAGTIREVASMATHIKGEIIPAERPGMTILVEREPMGVVLAISPWNAPVSLSVSLGTLPG
ncbi:aldehyde dehydrogenase [Apiospora marii]|uniref:Aldehyde dehydrogenase n=1 Tax=Apiospora marii TaxID=335849 RepID=A0ABR1RFS1_9PEZI